MKCHTACPHCHPLPADPHHRAERMDAILLYIVRPIFLLQRYFPRTFYATQKFVLNTIFRALIHARLVTEQTLRKQGKILNRTWLILQEAQRQNLVVRQYFFRRRGIMHFRIHDPHTSRSHHFEILPSLLAHHLPFPDIDDKYIFKKILQRHDLPFAEGRPFFSTKRAVNYGHALGYPLIVKPRMGSHSKHTTVNIQSCDELQGAVAIGKKISPEIMIEQYIPGNVYRVLMLDRHIIAAAMRVPPNIVGDGVQSIEELIAEKNTREHRAPVHDATATLHTIVLDDNVVQLLTLHGLQPKSILPAGQRLTLGIKVMLANGADIIDCTDNIHDDTREMFQRAYDVCNLALIGFDCICADMTQSWRSQPFAIIEANSMPFIDMHHFPTSGQTRNVANAIVTWMRATFLNESLQDRPL